MTCAWSNHRRWVINICGDLLCWVSLCPSYLLSLLLRRLWFVSLDLSLPLKLQAPPLKQPIRRLVGNLRFLRLKKMNAASQDLAQGFELRQNGKTFQ